MGKVLLILELCSNGIQWYTLMHLASIHLVACINHYSFPLLCGIPLCKYSTYFSTLLLMDIWVPFQSLAILNKTAMIVLTHVFWYIQFFLLGNMPRNRITLVHTAKWLWINYTSTCKVWEIQLFYVFAST